MRRIPASGLVPFVIALVASLPVSAVMKFTQVSAEGGHCAVARPMAANGWVAAGVGENFLIIDPAATGDGVVGRARVPGRITDIALMDSFAYVTCIFGGLRVLDLSQPTAIKEVARDTFASYFGSIHVSGKHVFVCDWAGKKLRSYDAGVPGSPVPLEPYAVLSYPSHFSMAGNRGYLSSESFKILDMTDIAHPVQLTPATYGGHENHRVRDGLAFHIGEGYARIDDISDPKKMREVALLRGQPEPNGCEYHGGIALEGGRVFLSTCDSAFNATVRGTLRAFDISDPARPAPLCTLALASSPAEISLQGDRAWVAVGPGGIQSVDISRRDSLRLAVNHPFPHAQDVAVIGSMAYGVDAVTGVNAYDLSNPEAPRRVGGYPLRGAWRVEAQGNRLYILGDSLLALDASDPAHLAKVGWANPISYRSMSASGTLVAGVGGSGCCLGGVGSEVEVLDFSSAGQARLVKRFMVDGYSETIKLSGDTVFTVAGYNRLTSYKLADTAAPKLLTTYASAANDVALAGAYLYLVAHNEGVSIYDRASGNLVGKYDKSLIGPGRLALAGGTAYLLGGYNGGSVEAVDVSNPRLPIQIGFRRLAAEPRGAALLGGHIVVATDKAGLGVYRLDDLPVGLEGRDGHLNAPKPLAFPRRARDFLGRKRSPADFRVRVP